MLRRLMLKKQIKMKTINWKNNQKNNKAMWNKVEELKKIELNAFLELNI